MKHSSLILIVIVFASACFLQFISSGQQAVAAEESEPELAASEPNVDSEADTTAVGPAITFEKVVHDFGNIGPGSENVCEFEFTNTGDKLLKIIRVSKTCGCTPFTLSKKKYEPGQSGTLKVKYNASKHPGSVRKTLTMYSNAKKNPEVKLLIRGNIVQKISYLPKSIDLSLNKENAGCPEITIKSLDGKPFSIRGIRAHWRSKLTKGGITADYDPAEEAAGFVLQPKFDMEKLKEGLRGYIEILLTHPESDSIAIPFKVLPRFKITPPSLIVYKAEPQKPVEREVWVLSNYDEDFEVESTSVQKGSMKVLSQQKIDNRYKFELEITPPAVEKGRKKFFTDVLFINIKGGEKLKITCRLFYS